MTNIVSFAARRAARPAMGATGGLVSLLSGFATGRRRQGDAWWLKENAELLMILSALNHDVPEAALAVYQPFHDGLEDQLAFHPQYYRMMLGVAVWLEDLGQPGDTAARMAARIASEGWIGMEVNDLQRAESRFLMARAGQAVDLPGLDARLTGFMSRPETFALPNPRAAYDLLHAVFYLSEYGRRPLHLPKAAQQSLHVLGNLAWLEQNGDLLGEVCIALRYAGLPVPPLWLGHLHRESAAFRIEAGVCEDSSDAYHNFLVNRWLMGTMGETAFGEDYPVGPMRFSLVRPLISPLREWSQALMALGGRREADYPAMRRACAGRLSPEALEIADRAMAEGPEFEAFFATFARPVLAHGAVRKGA
ncbi:hypothetical protein IQ03_00170 [Gemmobacter caeni]|jgi:hypothetical protein|uniref:Uncharacterized protein n=1 Tax=Gemmobacter caeni TaxID=589035 RepID=A0A2T6BB18_9RHOB|nr:hypothetical protein [Gemmobacter caeni]PTX53259.1 hypothetical protein C8N34_101172 [Gemmobacter caeni]TWJ05370.1 hypothetical protein IQ03_00170 [Gemmobacter caeni]